MTNTERAYIMTATDDPLVSTEWLAAHVADPRSRIIDASYKMPGVFARCRRTIISRPTFPGAVFFNVNTIADPNDPAGPHMYPNAPAVSRRDVSGLGISSGDYGGGL